MSIKRENLPPYISKVLCHPFQLQIKAGIVFQENIAFSYFYVIAFIGNGDAVAVLMAQQRPCRR